MERPHIEEEEAVEEESPDWRMLLKYTKSLGAQSSGAGNAEPFIPRRGEKDFEPTEAQAPVQLKMLQESRQALFGALSAGIRGHSSRDHVRCVWPGRVPSPPYVQGTAKGVLFSSIGSWSRERKRLELAPEELLYLIERGTVQCWTQENPFPISVQRAWAEIIGTNQLSLEKYQVYAYLKRLGYIVLRKEHVDSIWRAQRKTHQAATTVPGSFLSSVFSSLLYRPWRRLKAIISSVLLPNPSSVQNTLPALVLANRSLIHHGIWKTYESVFNALSLTPSGPKMDLPHTSSRPSEKNGGYSVFYYVYKPNNRFPKSSPPAPDFQVCVVDSENMAIPDIVSTLTLLDTVQGPTAPAYPPTLAKSPSSSSTPAVTTSSKPVPTTRQSSSSSSSSEPMHRRILSLLSFGFLCGKPCKMGAKKPVRQNVFAKIKRGERGVLLAINDHGVVSFLKFTETHFAGSPLVGAQSSI